MARPQVRNSCVLSLFSLRTDGGNFDIIFAAMSRRTNIAMAFVVALALVHQATSAAKIEIRAEGTWAVGGVTSLVKVKVSSLEGSVLSQMHWCVCDAMGKNVLDWKRPHGGITKTAQLKINLPSGELRSFAAPEGEKPQCIVEEIKNMK